MTIKDNNVRTALREQMLYAIQAVRAGRVGEVDVSNQSHNTIAETFHDFVYSGYVQDVPPLKIDIVYSDGSRSKAFPLHCLPQRSNTPNTPHPALRNAPSLRVSLISMRHLEMDSLVDMAWLLNSDVAHALKIGQDGKKLATVEMFSYEQTLQQLQALLTSGSLKIHLFQTGFQPVVIGFYRALIEVLREYITQEPVLEVTPYYFIRAKGRYGPGPRLWH
jgi:hypothetical protein